MLLGAALDTLELEQDTLDPSLRQVNHYLLFYALSAASRHHRKSKLPSVYYGLLLSSVEKKTVSLELFFNIE